MKELRLQKEREQKERLKLERTERRNKMKDFQEQDWMKTASVEDMLDTYDDFEDAEENQDEYFCAACSKVFKTEKQWLNHEQSKKHIKNVEFLRAQLLEEDEAIAQELGEVDDDFMTHRHDFGIRTEFGGKKTDDVAEGLYDEPIELSDVDIEVEVEIPKLKRRAKEKQEACISHA
ncbi:hypothetical protein BC829DRAFT_412990 [Chytridium lagenaria]|nr:hypothetical protein BC829DRAFT_412990 [Chytridium lagenaria]